MTARLHFRLAATLVVALFVAVSFVTVLPATSQPVTVDRDPFRINVQLEDVTRQVLGAPPRANRSATFGLYFNGVWERVVRVQAVSNKEGRFEGLTDRGTPLRISVTRSDTSTAITVEGPPDIQRIGYGFVIGDDERFYSYGAPRHRLDRRGSRVASHTDSSAVPFAMSTRGYGIYMENTGDFEFDFGQRDADLFTFWSDGSELTLHVIASPEPIKIVERYSDLSGRTGLPPTAQYGAWAERDVQSTHDDVMRDLQVMDVHDVRTATVALDRDGATSKATYAARGAVPSTPSTVSALRKADRNVVVDVGPYLVPGSPAYASAKAKGLLVSAANGDPLHVVPGREMPASAGHASENEADNTSSDPAENGALASATHHADVDSSALRGIVDFTHPDAGTWWTARLEELVKEDVHGVVLDEARLHGGTMHSGATGREARLQWRDAYIRSTREAFLNHDVQHPIVMGRAVDAGPSRRLSLVASTNWTADFDSTTGLPAAVTALQGSGLAGAAQWTALPDAGPDSVSASARARWIQFSAFTPSMHVGSTARVVQALDDPETATILRRYTQLHEAMSGYLYRQYKAASSDGTPVIRPLHLGPGRAETVAEHPHQYYLGSQLLIAPVVTESTERRVYLPPGEWMHFWTHETHTGDRVIDAVAPVDEIPAYVRVSRESLTQFYRPLYDRQLSRLKARLKETALTADVTTASAETTASRSTTPKEARKAAREALTSVLNDAPKPTADPHQLRSFLKTLDDARSTLDVLSEDGTIAPLTATTLTERLDAIERTLQGMIRLASVSE